MKTITNILLGIGIGIVGISTPAVIYVNYLLEGNKKIYNIGPLEKEGRDVFLLEKGIGRFKSQTLYWPTVLKEKTAGDGKLITAYDTVQVQHFKKLPSGKDFFKSKEYIELVRRK